MIVGDIGGTKTQLAVISDHDRTPKVTHLKRYINAEHDCFDGILSSYLMATGIEQPNALVLSVAGPVQDNRCMLTNLPWELDTQTLQDEFKISRVSLLNDLAATAHSIPFLNDDEFAWLQRPSDTALENGPIQQTISVLSAGTGLGEASLVYSSRDHNYVVIPGEGGHKNFAPNNDEELDLLTYYLRHSSHVSIETLVSGDGLSRIYDFLTQHPDWKDQAPSLSDADHTKNMNELITQLAYELPNSIYTETVSMFSAMLMSEAGNLALQTYSNGGVVIAGGIPPKILQFLELSNSLEAFRNKGRFSHWLSTLPVRVCLNIHAPLIGAWAFGLQQE